MFLSTCFLSGLARKEDFPFITYYCPHCHALNKPKQSDERISGLNSHNTQSPKTDDGEEVKNASDSAVRSVLRSDNPVNTSPEIEEVSEPAISEEEIIRRRQEQVTRVKAN